jgi:signal transduction histidine kinase
MVPGRVDDRSFPTRSFLLAGLGYPAGSLLAAPAALDPPVAWWAIGGCFLLVALIGRERPPTRVTPQHLRSLGAALVTLHLFLLAAANDMQPFYSLGSSLAVLATAFCSRAIRPLVAYSVFVTLLGTALFFAAPDPQKLAYWGSLVPLLFLACQRLALQLQLSQRRAPNELGEVGPSDALRRLAGGVAHDFNNLLTTIGIYAELVLAGLPEQSPLREEVKQIQQANRQAGSLTQQLLTLAGRSLARVDPIDLNRVVSEAEPMLRGLLSVDTKLDLQLAAEPQPIWGNLEQLRTILQQLAGNAQEAMTEPGLFSIEVRRCSARQLAERFVTRMPTHDEYVLLGVSDSGRGMPADVQQRAFDPFFTTQAAKPRAGLGLSIVLGILRQAEGHLQLHSEPGAGTRLELYWPWVGSKAEDSSPA